MTRTATRPVEMVLAALVAAGIGATSFVGSALAQPVPSDTAPPPPPDDEADPGAPQPEAGATPPPASAGPPAQAPDMNTFQQDLSAYGRWVQTPEYGSVWVPNGVSTEWRPYTDGRWVDTAWGWSFVSDVPWGWAAFHYGRWGFRAGLGWFWVPGYVWAPAWVSWRYYAGYVCWSPFAPAGFVYQRTWPGWVVVPSRAFTRPIRGHIVPWPHAAPVVRTARPAPSVTATPRRGSFYGPPREFVQREVRSAARPAQRGRR